MSKSEDIVALLVQQHKSRKKIKTQEQVSNLISYIVDGNMSVLQASVKANMSCFSARNYYNKYMEDPNHHIPKPYTMNRECTQDQIHKMINYIVDAKMTLEAACRKVNMSRSSGKRYYQKYLDDPNHAIPFSQSSSSPICTQEKINNLVYNIVDGKMSIAAAAKKANMSCKTGSKYYYQYLKDPKHRIPNPPRGKSNYTQENIQALIHYIANDNMSVKAASKKANVSYDIGKKYYRAYTNYIQYV